MPEPKATEEPPSRPPRISSNASQPGVPSSREYARCSPSTKFDAGIGGTFSGEPGRRSRPAETNHDSTESDMSSLLDEIADDRKCPVHAHVRYLLIGGRALHGRLDRRLLLGVKDDAAIDVDVALAIGRHRQRERE